MEDKNKNNPTQTTVEVPTEFPKEMDLTDPELEANRPRKDGPGGE